MVTNARSRCWPILLLLTAIMLVHPPSARADRIDINDPTALGPVLLSDEIIGYNPYETIVAEVRYQGGIYSYIYAVSSTPYFPGTLCCEAGMVSFAVTGHPLEDTWGAIYSSDVFWNDDDPDNPFVPRDPSRVSRQSSMGSVLFLNLEPAAWPWFTCSRLSRPRATGFSPTLAE